MNKIEFLRRDAARNLGWAAGYFSFLMVGYLMVISRGGQEALSTGDWFSTTFLAAFLGYFLGKWVKEGIQSILLHREMLLERQK